MLIEIERGPEMTYKEWITTTTARFNLGANDVELILVNQSVLIPDPEATVDVDTAKRALVNEFATLIPMANITEGGFSLSWNWQAIKAWYNLTCKQVGVESINLEAKPAPKIRNRSNIW